MSKKFSKKPLALALGAAFGMTGLAAEASLFSVTDLASGYMVAQATPRDREVVRREGVAMVKVARAERGERRVTIEIL